MSEGVDYASVVLSPVGLRNAGKTFACRYLSGGSPANPHSKDITAFEAGALHAAGMDVVLVWETDGRTGPLMGTAGGQADGAAAVAQARQLGVPAGVCLYFAIDFGAGSNNLPALRAYFAAARAVCHAAGYRCGDYGGMVTVTGDAGYVDLVWQTYAWSGGQWYTGAGHAIEQYSNGATVAGISVDLDRTTAADFGQWAAQGVPDVTMPAVGFKQGIIHMLFTLGREGTDTAAERDYWAGRLADDGSNLEELVNLIVYGAGNPTTGAEVVAEVKAAAGGFAGLSADVAKLKAAAGQATATSPAGATATHAHGLEIAGTTVKTSGPV